MFKFVIKRLLTAIPTVFLIITIAFFLIRVAPGGPFDKERTLPPEVQANLDKVYHLDKSLFEQYIMYLSNIIKGDFGPSFQYKDLTVTELIGYGFPVSLQLGFIAIILALCIGSIWGTIAALKQNTKTDYGIMGLAMTGITIPDFLMAPILILLLAVFMGVLPAGGWGDSWTQMILPVITLALPQISYIARMMRASMIEVLHSNYVRTAKSKGLSNVTIVTKHCLKPAMLPIISYLGPAMSAVFTGSVVVEQIFSIPGIGRYFIQGALNRDYTLVMGVVIFYGVLIVSFNTIVDIMYSILDPKVRIS